MALIKCLLCGREFKFLGSHLRLAHGTNAAEYRAAFGIPAGQALASEEYCNSHSVKIRRMQAAGSLTYEHLPAATEALRALGEGASRMELRVHPSDAPVLRQHLQDQPGAPAWQIHEDPDMARGGCRIEADTGIADASFETRWQCVMAAMGRDEEPLP